MTAAWQLPSPRSLIGPRSCRQLDQALLALGIVSLYHQGICDKHCVISTHLVQQAGSQPLLRSKATLSRQFEPLEAPPAHVGLSVGEVRVGGLDCGHVAAVLLVPQATVLAAVVTRGHQAGADRGGGGARVIGAPPVATDPDCAAVPAGAR